MNDRELLELAAKAAGISVEWREWVTARVGAFQTIKHTKHEGLWSGGEQWNPLTDDGAALRLAVILGMDIFKTADEGLKVYAACEINGMEVVAIESYEDDALPAIRKAIVRAAANIGRNLE